MNSINSPLLVPWFLVNQETWEMIDMSISDVVWATKKKVWAYMKPWYKQSDIDQVREVTSPLWEDVLCALLGWKKMKKNNNKWYDIVLPWWEPMEAKVWRIWGKAVIKKHQLDCIEEDWFYGIVYYRTTGNSVPSSFIAKDTKLDSKTYLKRNISLQSIFIFPKFYMVSFYNTTHIKEWKISTTGVLHKGLSYTSAQWLFSENINQVKKYRSTMSYGKHDIDIYSIGYEV